MALSAPLSDGPICYHADGPICFPPCWSYLFLCRWPYLFSFTWPYLPPLHIMDDVQFAYKAGHSCETALLRVYNDSVTTIGKSNGSFLVLLDLSSAFDTVDRDTLFELLEKYVGITGNALQLIKSYYSGRTQRVVIDGILSDFASLVCGVPHGSVLGPMKFCLYLLPLAAILRKHGISYHIYADDTQLYISFKSNKTLESLEKLNSCISDIRVWMIKQKLKINNAKTEFIIFRSHY